MNSIEHDQGYHHSADGGPSTDNPYVLASVKYQDWAAGWQMAREDHQKYLESQSPLREEDMWDGDASWNE